MGISDSGNQKNINKLVPLMMSGVVILTWYALVIGAYIYTLSWEEQHYESGETNYVGYFWTLTDFIVPLFAYGIVTRALVKVYSQLASMSRKVFRVVAFVVCIVSLNVYILLAILVIEFALIETDGSTAGAVVALGIALAWLLMFQKMVKKEIDNSLLPAVSQS